MMGYTILERCLQTDRARRRAARDGGFAVPVMHERKFSKPPENSLVTNSGGVLIPTMPSKAGVCRCAMFECAVDQEDALVPNIFRTLEVTARSQGWSNRCSSIGRALEVMRDGGLESKTLIVSETALSDMNIEVGEAYQTQALQGYVTKLHGLQTLVAKLPAKCAMVVAAPCQAGVYVRADTYLGLMLLDVSRTFMLVRDGVA